MPKAAQIVRRRYRRQQKKKQSVQSLARTGLILLFIAIVGGALFSFTAVSLSMLAYAAATEELPAFADLPQLTAVEYAPAEIYAEDETLLYRVEAPPRQWLPLDEMPLTAVTAAVALDPNYWESSPSPFAPSPLLERVISETIAPPTALQTLLLTHRAQSVYSKTEVVEWYLNSAYYGRLAYGIEAAAQTYFGKPAAALTLGEVAMLTAIPAAPQANPIDDYDAAKQRQKETLAAMRDAGLITLDEMTSAYLLPLQIRPPLDGRFDVIAPHFSLYVQQELESRFGAQALLSDGLKVYTGLNLAWQRQAECVAQAHVNRLSGAIGPGLPADARDNCPALAFLPPIAPEFAGIDRRVDNAAALLIDPRTGTVKAMVGGLNYWDNQTNAAVAPRQPGSILDPMVYLTALAQGYTPASMIIDTAQAMNDQGNAPYRGPMRLREGLGNGYANSTAQVEGWVGQANAVQTAQNLGLPPNDDRRAALLDLTAAYATMANMGTMAAPTAVLRVENGDGETIYEYGPQTQDILTPQLAWLINDMLADRSARCDGFGCPNVLELPNNRPTAVKSGQSSDNQDAWAIGYTPNLVGGVWMGNRDETPMETIGGIDGAAPIWRAMMAWALQEAPPALWPQPADLVELSVCDPSGLLATAHCPTVSELFIPGTQPTTYDNIYREIAVNSETGRLATMDTPPELIERQIFQVYPEQASAWALAQGIPQPPADYDTLRPVAATNGAAQIISPAPLSYIGGNTPISGTANSDNFDHYRLAWFKGLLPDSIQTIAEENDPVTDGLLGVWNTADLDGLYTLLLTAVNTDGSFAETSVQVTIDNMEPTAVLTAQPPQNSVIPLQATVSDNIGIERVEFYAMGENEPFATLTELPYRIEWNLADGCPRIEIIAVDLAGNAGRDTAVLDCINNEN